YAYFPILVEEEYRMSRNELYEILKGNGIYSRKYFYPLISDQACYSRYRGLGLENAREIAGKVLTLPFYADLEESVIEKVVSIIRGGKI
ncbi:MAG: DegT/DnrJ/EryC1/StrS family aminotransferase, partial [Ruminococcus flavefaciens]|nr:DegT/DnrJ/EryC1/StrS family aminotransferase [Ruminococcus flavefaciens]